MVGQLSPIQVRRLGRLIRERRIASGHTQIALALYMNMSKSQLSRFESGLGWPKRTHDLVDGITQALAFCGVSGEDLVDILTLAREADHPNWLATGDERGRSQHLDTLIDYESVATRIDYVSALVIPGLLQTRDYAEVVIAAHHPPAAELADRVDKRMSRQSVLSSVELSVVLSPQLLTDHIGVRAVMAGQVAHLLQMAQRPMITIRVLPATRMRLMANGGCAVLHFDDMPPIAQCDTPFGGGMFVDQQDGVARAMQYANMLHHAALNEQDSVRALEKDLSALQLENP